MPLNYESVREFTRDFHRMYEKETLLPDLTDLQGFGEEVEDLKYYKIGRRVGLPVHIVNEAFHKPTVESFVDNLVTGERNFILNQLNNKAETEDINTVPIEGLTPSSITKWCQKIDDPNHLFLPLDKKYFSKLFESNKVEDGERIVLSEREIQIHWIPLKHNITNGFVLSGSGASVVQKWFSDIDDPSEFDHDPRFDDLSKNRPLALYFSEDTFHDREQDNQLQEQVDFLYSVVISDILLSERDAIRLEPQRELSS